MGSCLGILRKPRPQSKPLAPTTHDPQGPAVPTTPPGCAGQEQVKEETTGAGDQLQHVSVPLIFTDENEGVGISEHDPQTLVVCDPSPSYAGPGQEQAKDEPSKPCDQPQPVSSSSGTTNKNEESIAQYTGPPSAISDPSPECATEEQGTVPVVSEEPQHVPSGSRSENEDIVISAIRATDVALGLRRLPAGFYIVLHHNGFEWRTENKPSLLNSSVVEWSGPIPISSDLSAVVRFDVYGSFEFRPTLGDGEHLRRLTVTVEQLLDRSGRDAPFTFSPKDGDIVSPCSSILVTVRRQKSETSAPSGSRVVGPQWSTPEPRGVIEDATNQGHSALTRYRKHGEKRDLERSIQQFERAVNVCMQDDPRRAAAQCNLGMATLIHSQVEGTDAGLEVALRLHRDALAARPAGHPDRLLTLIQLASAHSVVFHRGRNGVDEANAEGLLHEAVVLSTTASYEKQAATVMLRLFAGHREGRVESDGQSPMERNSTPILMDEDLGSLSVWLLGQFQRFGDLRDLERAITILEGLVKSMSSWEGDYCGVLGNLGAARMLRFQRLGQLRDLEEAISILGEAIHLSPDGHPDKPAYLSNLGSAFGTRFERLGGLSDLEEAVMTQREAVRLTPHNHPHKPTRLSNLGNSLRIRFERLEELGDLEDAISTRREAVCLSPHGHPDKPMYLNYLGTSFGTRFERLGELSDLEAAISTQKEAVHLSPHGYPEKSGFLHNLGTFFLTRFERLGEPGDLEEAISTMREAVHLTPDGDPHKPGYLSNLGSAFGTRFERFGEPSDLEDAISTLREGVHLTPDGDPDRPAYLSNLGSAFGTRFKRFGEPSDLEEAITTQKEAVHITPHDHPHKPACLSNLGNSFRIRFERLGEPSDLEDAISSWREGVHLTPDGDPRKPGYLGNLGSAFGTRFERSGELSDLEKAITTLREAVHITPRDHPHKPAYLSSLGNSFLIRFLHLGELSDLEDAISTWRECIHLTPDGDPDKPGYLSNLGNSFRIRFERLGKLSDLGDAISTWREGVHLTHDSDPDKPGYLGNLGSALGTRFERLGEPSDLEDAISSQREAVHLSPHGHPDKPTYLHNLGPSFLTRFLRLGELSDLEDAVSTLREAVHLSPDGDPDKPVSLSNLAASLQTRFERLGELSDLEEAISTLREAIRLFPDGDPHKPTCLNNLGASFGTRFERFGELGDLEEAISTLREAVRLTHGNSEKSMYLSNLGNSFGARFRRLGELSDLEDAILTQKEAVYLSPHGDPDKPGCLNNLGNCFQVRFECLGGLSDLEEAISKKREAICLIPHDHPEKPIMMSGLAESFAARAVHLQQLSDIQHALSLFSHVASIPIGPPSVRFSAARQWIQAARLISHLSLLHAYSVAVNLLPKLPWIGLSLSHRYDEITRGADLVREAAAAALACGFPETALEWLEQGRSVVWGELFQLRSSYEELSSAHPNYASRLHALSTQLDQASAAHEQLLSKMSGQSRSAEHQPAESPQEIADKHRGLAIERDKLLQEIRRLPGFERFLLRKPFSHLRAAANSGPVVILNAAKARCDALIIVAGVDHVIHVPLPNFSLERCTGLQSTMKHFVRHARDGKPAPLFVNWDHILSPLWKCVVKPVLDALAFSVTPGELSRIFWCPTGPLAFLPIHAAGFHNEQYSERGHKVFDFVVSSYVPSLATLIPSLGAAPLPSDDLRLLAVRQPHSDGEQPLPGVVTELEYIRDTIERFPSAHTTLVESSVGTVEEVLQLMRESEWVHFACHGAQDGVNSGLCLADGRRLNLRDIVSVSRPRGGLAFLSACQTAAGERELSDEAIHIAAGMLFAGYGGVIGSMWSISDYVAPRVARDVYTQLLRRGTRPNYRDAARALQETVGRLRNQGVPFEEWIPFIHVGL